MYGQYLIWPTLCILFFLQTNLFSPLLTSGQNGNVIVP